MIVNYPRMRRRAAWPDDLNTALEFASPEAFSISTRKNWDGKIEYSNGSGWKTWDGAKITSGATENKNVIYFRGVGNTKVSGDPYGDNRWVITGQTVSCKGNIERLLNWEDVENGKHPAMSDYCYASMFYNCTSLTAAPELPATTLYSGCYENMFSGCTSLTTAPALPATAMKYSCYENMFSGCTSLTTAPALPATTLSTYCYRKMFSKCKSLTAAPALPATTLYFGCYENMFSGCTSLTTAPALPATTLNRGCYARMFSSCISLTTVPALPATMLTDNCYEYMFQNCRKIKVSATANGTYTRAYRIPRAGAGTISNSSVRYMFAGTGGTFTGDPEINTTYYLDKSNTIV